MKVYSVMKVITI